MEKSSTGTACAFCTIDINNRPQIKSPQNTFDYISHTCAPFVTFLFEGESFGRSLALFVSSATVNARSLTTHSAIHCARLLIVSGYWKENKGGNQWVWLSI